MSSILRALRQLPIYVVTGKTRYNEFHPDAAVPARDTGTLNDSTNAGGALGVTQITDISGLVAWKDYIPVQEEAGRTVPYSYDANGYFPIQKIGGGALFSVTATARFWRIHCTELQTPADYFVLSQVQVMSAGVSQLSGGTALSSGGFGGYGPDNAFDGNPAGNPFAANAGSASVAIPRWIGYDMGVGNEATGDSVVLKNEGFGAAFNGGAGGSPKDFTVEVSDDGSSWTVVATITDEAWSGTSVSKTFTF